MSHPTPRCAARAVLLAAALASGACTSGSGDLAGCAEGPAVRDRPLRIATTVAPITSIVGSIASGVGAEITGIVPEGVDSHTYEPAPGDVATLADADVVFVNGLALESLVVELAEANGGEGAELCRIGDRVLPEDQYLFDVTFPEAAGDPNPHLWTNPPMVVDYADTVVEVLEARDPANAAAYRSNHDELVGAVRRLDEAVEAAIGTIPDDRRILLTYHDAYAYAARRYGLRLLGAVQPASFDEPSPREVAALVEQIRAAGVEVVFGSEVFPSPVLQQIAAETGARYVADLRDDDLPGDPGDSEHSWFEMTRQNFATIVEALGGDATTIEVVEGPALGDEARYP